MRLQIPYNEFEQLLSEYFQQKMIRQIKLAYVKRKQQFLLKKKSLLRWWLTVTLR